ncbi:MAG: hypothetical protein Kow00105_12830 [Phycisphaeraceae bacterium]
MTTFKRALPFMAALLFATTPSWAVLELTPLVQVDVGIMGNTQILMPDVIPTENPDQFDLTGQMMMPGMWNLTWDMTIDTDPFINGVFGLTNMSGSTQTFVLNVTIPITPVTPSSLIGGSVGGSVTDANNDGVATVANAGAAPLFDGQIDGVSVLPIIGSPFAFSAPFQGGTANIPATNVGLPGPTLPGPAALNSIGINHVFTLTPGDTVALTSFFVVEVPQPATLALLGAGIMAIVGVKRRA